MHTALRPPLVLLALLLACDSATKSDGQAAVNADARAGAQVQLDASAVADGVAQAAAEADAAAKAATNLVVALKPVAEVKAALGGNFELRAPDLDLAGVVDLIATGQVKTAAELELLLNAPGGAAHRVDIDADGKLDYLQIVELRGDAAASAGVNFEIRAIPSSKLDVSFAVLVATVSTLRAEAEGAIKIATAFAADVEGGADVHIEHDLKASFDGGAVVVADASAGAFAAWALDVRRDAYVSAHLTPVDIVIAADGAAQFSGDASASLDAARLATLRATLKLELLAAVDPPQIAVESGAKAKAKAGVDVDHSASAESAVQIGSGGGVKIGGGAGGSAGVSIGGSAGVSIGGSAGASVGTKGKASGGIKIGR